MFHFPTGQLFPDHKMMKHFVSQSGKNFLTRKQLPNWEISFKTFHVGYVFWVLTTGKKDTIELTRKQ